MSIHRVLAAALELQGALEEIGRPYCIIGGLALQRWGEIRFTQDADATISNGYPRYLATALPPVLYFPAMENGPASFSS